MTRQYPASSPAAANLAGDRGTDLPDTIAHAKSERSGLALANLPQTAGIGLRHPHIQAFLDDRPAVGFLEVHSENYLGAGGPRMRALLDLRRDYAISCHGVGLSLGSAEGLNREHLQRLRDLFHKVQPAAISEHVSWSIADGVYLNDLLPLPYTEEALEVLCRNINQAQDAFGRPLLMENPSTYLELRPSAISEAEFLAEMVQRTGCGLLLDVNNLYVSSHNNGFDVDRWLTAIPSAAVGEIHMAGHSVARDYPALLIDDHGAHVAPPVWDLLNAVLQLMGPRPILVEWDTRIPKLPVLMAEMIKAQLCLDHWQERGAPDAA